METDIPELVRQAMRRWVTGVAVATSRVGNIAHGMTVNSFTSISLAPPLVTVTMNNGTRTYELVKESGIFALTLLSQEQQEISDRFAGQIPENEDRLAGIDTFVMLTGAPLLVGGLAFMDCRVVFEYPMPTSTLFIAEVVSVQSVGSGIPLVYFNRGYGRLMP
jgi:flavin reductase (DIM6/NTAB) family NADH-FMN oxidoreductase RutF